MKRMLNKLLLLALCLCMVTTAALAVDGTIIPERADGEPYRAVREVVTAGDTVWFRMYTSGGREELWYWQPDMAQAEVAATGLLSAASYNSFEELLQSTAQQMFIPDAQHAITEIFTDGEQLYGFNHLNGQVFTMTVSDGIVDCIYVTTLQDTSPMFGMSGDYRYYAAPEAVACAGNKLLWCTFQREENEDDGRYLTYVYDLSDGTCQQLDAVRTEHVANYQEGKALVLTRDVNDVYTSDGADTLPITINVYDSAANTLTAAGMIEDVDFVQNGVYASEIDAFLYQDGTEIMGMKGLTEKIRYAYVPTRTTGMMTVLGDTLVFSETQKCYVRTLAEGYETAHSVRVLNGTMTGSASSFAEKYPTVPVYMQTLHLANDIESYIRALTAEEDISDAVRMYVESDPFIELRDEGYLLDLSGYPAIADFVGDLYPAFKEVVMKDGAIYGVPLSAGSYNGFFINKKVMEAMGLTEADIPTNLVDLCAFVTRWNDEFAEKYPNYAALDGVENYRREVLELILESWMAYCQAMEQPLHFDDPILRELLTAFEAMKTDKIEASLQVTDPEVSDYKSGLIWRNVQLVGNWAAYMEDFSDRIFIPMTLTADTEFTVEVATMQVVCVNAKTQNAEYTVKLLEEYIGAINDKYLHVLLTTETDPTTNPYYAQSLAYEQELLESAKAAYEKAEEEAKAYYREEMERLEQYINNDIKRDMYSVTPSAIENYVNVLAPAMYVKTPAKLGIGNFVDVSDRYLEGVTSMEQLLAEMDALLLIHELDD